MAVEKLVPYVNNVRTYSPEQIETDSSVDELLESIKEAANKREENQKGKSVTTY